jgi:hypothetical protein
MTQAVQQSDAADPVNQTSGLREVRFEYTPEFPRVLESLGSALLVSTYQAGKLLVVGVHAGQLTFAFHHFERVMGVAAGGGQHIAAQYIALAVRLATHSDFNQTIRQQIAETSPTLYDNQEDLTARQDLFHNLTTDT